MFPGGASQAIKLIYSKWLPDFSLDTIKGKGWICTVLDCDSLKAFLKSFIETFLWE